MRAVDNAADHDVAYVTDVEGQWPRLDSFLRENPLVRFDDAGRIVVRGGATFVFGGDAIDRGPDGRRVVRALLDVKRRQPSQVVLLAGNRDLNKLRLATELCGAPPRRTPEDVRAGGTAGLLRWIFQHTMGAAEAFAHRQTELTAEGAPHDDAAVVQSYLDDLSPTGTLAAYLRACQLAWRSGATLFVHGGVAAEALQEVPRTWRCSLERFDVDAWIAALHTFYAAQVDAFCARSFEADGTPSWEDAVLYQAPRRGMKSNPGSVVYGRMSDEHNNPELPDAPVIDALLRCHIQRVVVGHTPSGDVPSVVRALHTRQPFETVICDNSRSRVASASRVSVRDAALCWSGRCVLDGDADAVEVTQTLPIDDRATPVGGRVEGSGALVKAVMPGGWLTFRYLPGYAVEQRLVAPGGPLSEATFRPTAD